MLAQRLYEPKPVREQPLKMEEQPLPQPQKGQVRLHIRTCGVCHTDLHTVEGEIHPPSLPVTPGHQVVGIVDELGEGVENISLGQRVGVPWLYSTCGECNYCQNGHLTT